MIQQLKDARCGGDVAFAYHRLGRPALFWKRVFDLTVAIAALVLLAPLFIVIALLIKLDSRGPVFFRQVRVGRHRRRFHMWKFRKMHHDLPEQGPNLTRRYDTRLTRLGRLLERTKLDELPQFFNVLTGEMSLVGPRPEVPPFVEHYPEKWDRVLSVKPGIFGPCQVRFRNESEMYPDGCRDLEGYYARHILPAKLAIDADYASRYSLLADVLLLFQAVFVSFGGIITKQTLMNRRWQIVNTLILSLAGFAGTVALARLLAPSMSPDAFAWLLLISALVKPTCVIVFKIPKALATSVTADDLLRCCWCAAVSGALLGSIEFLAGFRDLARSVLLADTVLFLAVLVLYKMGCYNIYACFFRQRVCGLWGRLIVASVIFGPLSMAAVLLIRYGRDAWNGAHLLGVPGLLLLALLVRPAIFVFKPITSHGIVSRPIREWTKIFLGALVGSSLIVSGSLLLNERGIGRLDVACDGLLYLLAMTGVIWWHHRQDRHSALAADGGRNSKKERLLIVGEGAELSGYISALASLPEHCFKVVGALSTHRGYRTNMAGGVPVLGELADAPEVVRAMDVTRVVVLDTDISDDALDELRVVCDLEPEQLLRVGILSPLMRLWRRDQPGITFRPRRAAIDHAE